MTIISTITLTSDEYDERIDVWAADYAGTYADPPEKDTYFEFAAALANAGNYDASSQCLALANRM